MVQALESSPSAHMALLTPRGTKLRDSEPGRVEDSVQLQPNRSISEDRGTRTLKPEVVFMAVIAVLGLALWAAAVVAKRPAGALAVEQRAPVPRGQAAARAAANWSVRQGLDLHMHSKQAMVHGDSTHILQCQSSEQVHLQASAFRQRNFIESACTEHPWLKGLQTLWPARHHVLLDIGCNLGYVSVELFDRFVPELGISKRALYQVQEGTTDKEKCNVCDQQFYPGECTQVSDTPLLPAGVSRSVEVHCFEPGEIHYPRLVRNRARLFHTNPDAGEQGATTAGWGDARERVRVATRSLQQEVATTSSSSGDADPQEEGGGAPGSAPDQDLHKVATHQDGQGGQKAASPTGAAPGSASGGKGAGSPATRSRAAEHSTPRKVVGASWGEWHLHNYAMSNFSGTAQFSSGCNNGRCSLLDKASSKASITVKVSTVDEFTTQQRIHHVDVMKIDTEGFDPLVLKGARSLLERRGVSVITFEYHKLKFWQRISLKETVEYMEGLGYVCYFEGRPYLYKLSRSCWSDKYEIHQWSNVVCAVAGGALERLMDAHSFLRVVRKGVVSAHDKLEGPVEPDLTEPEEYEER